MGQLGRRVDALEAIAEEARRRELRDRLAPLAARRGVSVEAVLDHFERLQGETARLRAAGLSDDAIMADKAARMGIAPDELRRHVAALANELAG